MFLKVYNYFVRGIFIFLFIGMTVSLIINPEIIEDENDIYFFIASYITILVFYFGWGVNVNIRMYNFDDVQCTVIPSVAYGFVTGMNLQLC